MLNDRRSADAHSASRHAEREPESLEKTILTWLARHGIAYDLFANTESEHDADLGSYYVEPPIFGRALEPVDTLILAEYGAGKTALRKRIEAHHQASFNAARRLVFSYVIPVEVAEAPPPELAGHLPYILASAVKTAFIALLQYGATLDRLQENEALAGRFARFFDAYYPMRGWVSDLEACIEQRSLLPCLATLRPDHTRLDDYLPYGTRWLTTWNMLLQEGRSSQPNSLAKDDITREWLSFCALLEETGIKSIEMLVDGVDERRQADNDTPRMIKLTTPLARACRKRSLGSSVTIKLFLPIQLSDIMRKELSGIRKLRLVWTPARLRDLIKARLLASSGGKVRSLWGLAKLDIDVDMEALEDWMIRKAQRQPRILLHAIRKLFMIAASLTTPEDPAIGKEIIEEFKKRYNYNRYSTSPDAS